jgi:hypothetical protein
MRERQAIYCALSRRGGKRSATPLSEPQLNHRTRLVIPKAPSPLRSAGAFQIEVKICETTPRYYGQIHDLPVACHMQSHEKQRLKRK